MMSVDHNVLYKGKVRSLMLKKFLFLFILIAAHTSLAVCPSCVFNNAIGSPFTVGVFPTGLAFSPSGCIAVTNQTSGTVSIFKSDPTTCTLTNLENVATGPSPFAAAYSPDGNCLAVVMEGGGGTVSLFTVNSDCTLVTPAPTFSTEPFPTSVAFSPSGNCLAITDGGTVSTPGDVSMFTVSDCTSIASAGNFTVGFTPSSVAFSPDGHCLAVSSVVNPASGSVSTFTNSNCSLVTADTANLGSFNLPTSLAFSPITCPNGNYLLAVANSTRVSIFTVNHITCALQLQGNFSVGTDATSVAFSPNGQCLAVTHGPDLNTPGAVSLFAVSNCTLTLAISLPTQVRPAAVAFSSSGDCLAVLNQENPLSSENGNVSMYSTGYVLINSTVRANCDGTVTITGTANPGNFITIFEGSAAVSPTVTASSPSGSFTVTTNILSSGSHTLTIRSANFVNTGCFRNFLLSPVTVSPLKSLSLTANPTALCLGQTSTLTASVTGGIAPFTYHFSDGFSVTTSATTVIHTVTPAATTTYTVSVTDGRGCAITSNSVTVTVAAAFSVVLTTSPVIISCPENLTNIFANFVCGTPPYVQATISNGISTITIPNPSNPLVYPVVSNTTTYTFTVKDSASATTSSSIVA